MISLVGIIQYQISSSCDQVYDQAREASRAMRQNVSHQVQRVKSFVIENYDSHIVPNCRNVVRFCQRIPTVTINAYDAGRQGLNLQLQRVQQFTTRTYQSSRQGVSRRLQQVQQRVTDAYQSCRQSVNRQVERVQQFTTATCRSIEESAQQVGRQINSKCQEITERVSNVFEQNKRNFFFIACSITTAYLAPQFFFPAAVVTVIARIELAHFLKKAAQNYFDLKDDNKPYKSNRYEECVNSLDFTLGTIAAIDSLALGTFYLTGYWSVALLPILGGIAAGNAMAKWGMNSFNFFAPPART